MSPTRNICPNFAVYRGKTCRHVLLAKSAGSRVGPPDGLIRPRLGLPPPDCGLKKLRGAGPGFFDLHSFLEFAVVLRNKNRNHPKYSLGDHREILRLGQVCGSTSPCLTWSSWPKQHHDALSRNYAARPRRLRDAPNNLSRYRSDLCKQDNKYVSCV